ncbi:MAG: hypothetical protein RLN99_14750 [Kiloniellaceae bacterium]
MAASALGMGAGGSFLVRGEVSGVESCRESQLIAPGAALSSEGPPIRADAGKSRKTGLFCGPVVGRIFAIDNHLQLKANRTRFPSMLFAAVSKRLIPGGPAG